MPKSSIAIMLLAIGVLVAPAKTATNPMPANKAIGKGMKWPNAFPNAAPINHSGVTSPPLKLAANVRIVKNIFKAKA